MSSVEEYAEKIAADAPPLSSEQRDVITAAFAIAGAKAGEAA